jgi:hypothetical protein
MSVSIKNFSVHVVLRTSFNTITYSVTLSVPQIIPGNSKMNILFQKITEIKTDTGPYTAPSRISSVVEQIPRS